MKVFLIKFIVYNIKFLKDNFYDLVIYILFFMSHIIAYLYYFNLYN